VDVVAAAADHLVRRRLDVVLLGRTSGDGVEADVRDLGVLVDPHVGAVVLVDAARRVRLPLVRQMGVEERRRLDHVVVDADQDEILGIRHAMLPLVPDVAVSLGPPG
jgi:hypothetical protein